MVVKEEQNLLWSKNERHENSKSMQNRKRNLTYSDIKPFGITKNIWAEVEMFKTTSVVVSMIVPITAHWWSPRATLTGVPLKTGRCWSYTIFSNTSTCKVSSFRNEYIQRILYTLWNVKPWHRKYSNICSSSNNWWQKIDRKALLT